MAAGLCPGKPLHVTVGLAGDSLRSVLDASAGNLATACYDMPDVRFLSGGRAATAFNRPTASALQASASSGCRYGMVSIS